MYSHSNIAMKTETRAVAERFGLHRPASAFQDMLTVIAVLGFSLLCWTVITSHFAVGPQGIAHEVTVQSDVSYDGIVLQMYRGR